MAPPSPSDPHGSSDVVSRRALLAGLGTAGLVGTTGCLGRLPGIDRPEFETEPIAEDDPSRIAWGFPAETADSGARVGYVEVLRRGSPADTDESYLRLDLNASSTLSSDRKFDQYTFRLRLPQHLHREYGPIRLYARPPVGIGEIRVSRDTAGANRGVVVDHRSVFSDGTLITEAVLGPRYDSFPPVVDCAFAGRLSTPSPLGETARVEARGRLRLRPEAGE